MVGGLNFLDLTLLSSFNSGLHYFVSCLLFVSWLFLVISTFFNQFVNTLIWYTVVASSRLASCLVDRLVSCSLKPIEWSALDHSKLFFCWFPPPQSFYTREEGGLSLWETLKFEVLYSQKLPWAGSNLFNCEINNKA